MRFTLNILYSFIFYPLLLALFHVWAVTNASVRKALKARYQYLSILKEGLGSIHNKKKVILLHTSSMGEFEHVKPLITEMHKTYQSEFVVTFFSPSGYENVHAFPGVCFFMYLPFDFKFIWNQFYKLLKPRMVLISKHDVWPNQVWTARTKKIPTYLINASLPAKSSRINPLARFFQKFVYRSLTTIFTIGAEDALRFKVNFPRCRIREIGDTKFDQVLQRKKASEQKKILPEKWLKNKTILLFGSIWPEDSRVLFPAVEKVLLAYSDLRIILVPHQPEAKYIQEMEKAFKEKTTMLYSKQKKLANKNILIIDQIGILADLYKYASLAYVGGSFRQGIHNVMEPAIYGIPVLHGPVYKNAFEADELLKVGGSAVINDTDSAEQLIKMLIEDAEYREMMGEKAIRFAEVRTGGTEALIEIWKHENRI